MFENLSLTPYKSDKKLLYHYTGPEKLLKILESLQLKFSKFDNLNDLNEIEVNFQITDFKFEINIQEYIIQKCRLISFSKDYIKGHFIEEWGINHPRMWAQYADNNKGACIVLNEEKLLEKNQFLKECDFFRLEDVQYDFWTLNDNIENIKDPEEVIKQNFRRIFFKKSKDWELERERRLFILGNIEYLDINNCIEYICLGFRFNQFGELINLISENHKRKKQVFTPHEIVKQVDSYGRINAFEISHVVMELLKKQDSYLKFLKKNGYSTS